MDVLAIVTLRSKLYSYCIPYDDGAAPNPFGGTCTLVICKPVVRRTAEVGDWIVGTGSKRSPVGDTSGRLVYAMRVTDKLSMSDYDARCRAQMRWKIPECASEDILRRVGDCIYDFSQNPAALRPSVHSVSNRKMDLGGQYALLSKDFYYFGKAAPPLPDMLAGIVKQGQGHRSVSNDPYLDTFIAWIRALTHGVNGDPQMWGAKEIDACGSCRARSDEEDDQLGCEAV
jgi:hypothetical protein